MMTTSAAPSPTMRLTLPEGASLPRRVRVAWNALRVLSGDPKDPEAAHLLNLCLDREAYARVGAELARSDGGRWLLAERPPLDARVLDLAALERVPEGTLGRELVRYYEANGITPFESPFEIRDDVEYLCVRYRDTHDAAHVLTGYDTDFVGEMELQAFMLGNLRIPTAALILTFSLVNRLQSLRDLPRRRYFRRIGAAYRRGRAAERLIAVRYEEHWEAPLSALRERLGLTTR